MNLGIRITTLSIVRVRRRLGSLSTLRERILELLKEMNVLTDREVTTNY